MNIPKSTHHQAFIGPYEYFLRDGELYRAPASRPVMRDGFRCGRWEAPAHMVKETLTLHRQLIEKNKKEENL